VVTLDPPLAAPSLAAGPHAQTTLHGAAGESIMLPGGRRRASRFLVGGAAVGLAAVGLIIFLSRKPAPGGASLPPTPTPVHVPTTATVAAPPAPAALPPTAV